MRTKFAIATLCILLHLSARAAEPADSSAVKQDWGIRCTQMAASLSINIGLTEILKHSVSEMRPDGTGDDSFPSRHTSWAYNIASISAHELYQFSPWIVPGMHIAASAVGMQRVMSRRHYPGDVLAGAATGIVSTEIGYWIGDLIYHKNRSNYKKVDYELRAAFDYETQAIFPVNGLGEAFSTSTGIASAARISCPLGNKFGVVIAAKLITLPIYLNGNYTDVLKSFGFLAGGTFGIPIKGRWGFEGEIRAGASHLWGCYIHKHNRWAFDCDATAGFPCRITDDLSVGLRAGYSLMVIPKAVSMLTLSFFTQVTF